MMFGAWSKWQINSHIYKTAGWRERASKRERQCERECVCMCVCCQLQACSFELKGPSCWPWTIVNFLKASMTSICPQSTTNHHEHTHSSIILLHVDSFSRLSGCPFKMATPHKILSENINSPHICLVFPLLWGFSRPGFGRVLWSQSAWRDFYSWKREK